MTTGGRTLAGDRETVAWECVLEPEVGIGEAPVWSPDQRCLFWIDVFAGRLHRTDPDSGITRTWELQETIGSFVLVEGTSSAVVALQSGIHLLDLESGERQLLHAAPYDPSRFRFNDGRCDRQGRFWVGNNPLAGVSPRPVGASAFWCLEQSGLRLGVTGTTIANGIAFSPDGGTLYLADDESQSILAFDYDTTRGEASNRRVLASVPAGSVIDGAAVDTRGGYWVALPKNGLIARYTPEGELDRVIDAPTSFPTMVCFGGDDLRQMYVTTGRKDYDGVSPEPEPRAGGIFRCDVGEQGIPEPRLASDIIEKGSKR